MAEEKKVDTTVETKERSKTDKFKEHLQQMIYQSLGVKVSKDKAWGMFKDFTHGTVEFVLNLEDKSLPLAGVGTFEVLETKPRGSKAGLDKDGNPIEGAEAWPCVPRYRFYPSSVTEKLVEQVYGLKDHGVEVKHYGIFAEPVPVEENSSEEKKAKKVKAPKKDEVAATEVAEEKKETAEEFDEDLL